MASILAEAFLTLFKRIPVVVPTEEVYQKGSISMRSSTPWLVGGVSAAVLLVAGFILQGGFTGIVFYLALSLLPVAVLFGWLLKTDRYEPEPKSLILAVVGIGVSVSATYSLVQLPSGITYYFFRMTVIELIFLLILYVLDANRITGREFNDHLDGAIYGLSLGLGYVLYENFHMLLLGSQLVRPEYLLLLSLEGFTLAVFPALTGWWIGYVKAKYVSIGFKDVFAGFIPVIILKLLCLSIFTFAAMLEIISRILITLFLALLFLSVLVRRISWALQDEIAWGYAAGKAPVEKGA